MPNTAKTALRELLTAIVRSLVDRPEDVAIEVLEGENHSTLQIRSHPADLRRLVGEHGRTADAIRVVVNASAVKRGFGRFNVEFEKLTPSTSGSE
jgi:predicted RNA-binding protein YlqC (UPF0109 family)